jgi:hypothetical protein
VERLVPTALLLGSVRLELELRIRLFESDVLRTAEVPDTEVPETGARALEAVLPLVPAVFAVLRPEEAVTAVPGETGSVPFLTLLEERPPSSTMLPAPSRPPVYVKASCLEKPRR